MFLGKRLGITGQIDPTINTMVCCVEISLWFENNISRHSCAFVSHNNNRSEIKQDASKKSINQPIIK